MAFLVATTSLPAVYRLNGYARTTTAETPQARAKMKLGSCPKDLHCGILPQFASCFIWNLHFRTLPKIVQDVRIYQN